MALCDRPVITARALVYPCDFPFTCWRDQLRLSALGQWPSCDNPSYSSFLILESGFSTPLPTEDPDGDPCCLGVGEILPCYNQTTFTKKKKPWKTGKWGLTRTEPQCGGVLCPRPPWATRGMSTHPWLSVGGVQVPAGAEQCPYTRLGPGICDPAHRLCHLSR